MDLLYALFLGFLQGATEFLPISSSAHLLLAEYFLRIEQAGLSFDVALHMGSLIAILIYFWRDFYLLGRAALFMDSGKEANRRRRQAIYICLATIPAVVAGLLLGDAAETTFREPWIVGITLSVAGFFLLVSDKKGSHSRSYKDIGLKDAIIIGCAQAMALIPGVSRSGSTMTAALFLGLDRSGAALFSFLLSAPIVLGAGIYKIPSILGKGLDSSGLAFYGTGFLSALFFGYFFIAFLMKFVRTRSLAIFAYYRFGLSALVFIALALG
ncbi:MAG: undecaprenyl-diphosphatase UppP [Desulfobulbaceae bacterium]|nr:undecaprenyl-diphosphatase UppP [Desulfobulbaceae bacterium]